MSKIDETATPTIDLEEREPFVVLRAIHYCPIGAFETVTAKAERMVNGFPCINICDDIGPEDAAVLLASGAIRPASAADIARGDSPPPPPDGPRYRVLRETSYRQIGSLALKAVRPRRWDGKAWADVTVNDVEPSDADRLVSGGFLEAL